MRKAKAQSFRDAVARAVPKLLVATLEEAEEIFDNGKAVILIGCNIHATEIASSQMSMELAHSLATEEDAVTRAIRGDVVVLLSRQPLLPFAWPLIGSPDHLVAIRTARIGRPREDTVLRNVIAHELGHTLGLRHNRGGASLMCGPCSSLAARESPGGWLPLTARDRALLRALHGGGERGEAAAERAGSDLSPD